MAIVLPDRHNSDNRRKRRVFVSRTTFYDELPQDFGLDSSPYSADGLRVSEQEYWEKYCSVSDYHYEWNNGVLEEKPVSDYATFLIYKWLFTLVDAFLHSHPIAKMVALETAFRMQHGNKKSIRKPDFFVVRNDNPVPYLEHDRSFGGIADLCVEAISDSNKKEVERDTKTKYSEYMLAGVREYYLLDAQVRHSNFLRLNASGKFEPIPVAEDKIVRSGVLPGFQFRLRDLYDKPSLIQMATDEVYRHFVLPEHMDLVLAAARERDRADEEKRRAEQERQRAEAEYIRAERERMQAVLERYRADAAHESAEQARQISEQEHQRAAQARQEAEQAQQIAEQARQRAERLAAKLRALGIDEDEL